MKKYNWGVVYSEQEAQRMCKDYLIWHDLASDSKESYDYYMTLEEIGRELMVSKDRIRQIEAKALKKLQHPKRAKILREFLHKK